MAQTRNPAPYRPGHARVGEATPQTAPELFTRAEIVKEVKYLIGLNKRYGSHPLRTIAYMKLINHIQEGN